MNWVMLGEHLTEAGKLFQMTGPVTVGKSRPCRENNTVQIVC